MRKITFILITVFGLFFLAPKIFAHELFIDIKQDQESNELQIDVKWGHLRDFLDQANYEDYKLFVRDPNGEIEQLQLEKIGVQARAYLFPTDKGEYVFWAERTPSTYSPSDGLTTLSVQMAKTVHQEASSLISANEPVNLLFEIVPQTNLSNFSTGEFAGSVFFEGKQTHGANISAYGPKGELLENTSNENGEFEFDFNSIGQWLIKANIQNDEIGSLNNVEYSVVGHTSTLLIDTSETAISSSNNSVQLTIILALVVGMILGAFVIYFIVKKRLKPVNR